MVIRFPITEGVNVDHVRFASGRAMAKKDNVEADYVSGIPDSGIGMALRIYRRKADSLPSCHHKIYTHMARSFTPSNQMVRNLVARMKLIPNRQLLKDKRVVFVMIRLFRGISYATT